MQDPLINRQIGDFLVQDLLEKRTAVSLYRATQQSLKRFVLFKVVNHKGIQDRPGELAEDLEAYIHNVVGLEHLHLQPIYAYGVIDPSHIYVAGRYTSGTLADLLEAGALPEARALEFAGELIEALSYIQSKGLIHRSLAPTNIYLDQTGGTYLNDLELAHIVKSARTLDELKRLLDTPFYTSPEQLACNEVDFCSEVYNFGAVLYHMVAGIPPFSDGDTSFEAVLERKLRNQLLPPRRYNPAISAQLEALILRLMSANPQKRFADIASVRDPIKQLKHGVEPQSPEKDTLLSKLKTWLAKRF